MKTSPLLARLMPVALADVTAAPAEIMVFPAGTHTINASQAGKPITKSVKVGPDTAAALQAALTAHLAAGPQKPYFDFDHDDTKASAWPAAYRWEPGAADKPAGVYAKVDWSASGAAAVLGKDYRSFSPAFHVDDAVPARVIGAPLNQGGLVNAPAFRAQAPLWAKEQSSAATPPNHNPTTTTMTDEEKKAAEAAAANAALQTELQTLKARETAQQQELLTLKAKETERRKADASAKVAAAVARGALPPKDETIQAKWRGLIEADPSHAELLAALPDGTITQVVTSTGGHIQAKEGLNNVLKGYKAARTPKERAAIYAKEIEPLFKPGFALGPILAANALGELAGDLVTQRSLALLKLTFPVLKNISTNFTEENAAYGQTIKTRLRAIPAVTAYDPVNGYAASDVTDTDVPVVINNHNAVQIKYTANDLASTARDLFGEQVEGCHYSLGKSLVDALYALITVGNYANGTVQASAGFGRPTLITVAEALFGRSVAAARRTCLLNPTYFGQLSQDASLVSLAAFQKPEMLTDYMLPPVAGFDVQQAVNLPGTGNLGGAAFTPDAMAMAVRVPNDYTTVLPGASNGNVSVVTNPDTGFTVQLVQYVDHNHGTANWRIAFMFGVAVGNAASLQRITSA